MNCIGVNYKKLPLEIRERYAFLPDEQRAFHKTLHGKTGCTGSVILSTCNRSELYVCGKEDDAAFIARVEEELSALKGIPKTELLRQIYVYSGENALRHLFHVACGLDSMVLGEDEILRQVKDGYELAVGEGAVCNEIHIAFQGAFGSAKSIKTQTLLSRTPVSMGTLAANRIEAFLREYGGGTVLIAGITGKIGRILAKNLIDKKIINIVGTTRRHFASGQTSGAENRPKDAETPSAAADGPAWDAGAVCMVPYADRYRYVDAADVIVSATSGPHYTFLAQETASAIMREKERLFLDMAVPRDMDQDIARLPGCQLLDIDDFKKAAAQNNERKRQESDRAGQILEEKLQETIKSIRMSEFMEKNRQTFQKLADQPFGKVFYRLKDELSGEELSALLLAVERVGTSGGGRQ